MSAPQMIKVLQMYCEELEEKGYKPEKNPYMSGNYAYWMCKEVLSWPLEEVWEKANRWLGFIQGIFWTTGLYSIDEMREHNRT